MIATLLKLFGDALEDVAVREGEHSRDVFEDKGLGLELVQETDIVLEERISGIFQESIWCVNREALARRATGHHGKLAPLDPEPAPHVSRVNLLDGSKICPRLAVVELERLNRRNIRVVAIEAPKARLPEPFCQASRATE